MLRSVYFGRGLTGAATLALLAGCSGGNSSGPVVPPAYPGAAGQSIAMSQSFVPHFKQIDALGGIAAPSATLRFDDPDLFDPAALKSGVYGANYGNAGGDQLGGYFKLFALPANAK